MTAIPIATFIILGGGARLVDGLDEDRCIRTDGARNALPPGAITIDADECYAVADGDGGFLALGMTGAFPARESVVLPAYVIAGPDLPPLIPGGGTVLAGQDDIDQNISQFHAIDAYGSLLTWAPVDDTYSNFAWETAGQTGEASPVFPITAWY